MSLFVSWTPLASARADLPTEVSVTLRSKSMGSEIRPASIFFYFESEVPKIGTMIQS